VVAQARGSGRKPRRWRSRPPWAARKPVGEEATTAQRRRVVACGVYSVGIVSNIVY
jgi:hypothetical protein